MLETCARCYAYYNSRDLLENERYARAVSLFSFSNVFRCCFKVNRSLSGNSLITMPRKALRREPVIYVSSFRRFHSPRPPAQPGGTCSEINYKADSRIAAAITGDWSMSKWLLVVVFFLACNKRDIYRERVIWLEGK